MEHYFDWFYHLLINNDVADKDNALLWNLLLNLVVVGTIIWALDYILRKIIVGVFSYFTNKTKTTFDDFLVRSSFPKYIAHVIPFIIIRKLLPFLFDDFKALGGFLISLTDIYLILLLVWIIRSVIKSIRDYLKILEEFKDKPWDSYAQILVMFVWFIGVLLIISEVADQSVLKFVTTLGAASAIILLIFKDTILGFVASIQVSVNDMVRIGDWISMSKYGADGDVIEINLTTVKVSNWDKTITTIPTYALISDSFQNWRGMQETGGRRIKRALHIKVNSIKFMGEKDLERLSRIQLITDYIDHRQKDIDNFNSNNKIDKSLLVNGRNQTNMGLFRKYTDMYINGHPAVHKGMTIMTRHLDPSPQGIPLEIYMFSKDIRWVNYEHIMADIFEHLIAATAFFDLELFEYPTGKDVKSLKNTPVQTQTKD
ncbi:mechanosensitive ion channel family protein [Flavobacteriaceae bacterium F89]|uniref:Mechanosensing system component YbdG n=1 Tax=Cerina litoralis TaxID=2874477 RepID=A0AAE3EQR3_9FLAO|nr:mechanosensitive ion channel domain-containing protein [Cerina litoralis]MCG2459410.1 mechanosensitive ion channel family protein [Cerina litoralis]